ncbi:MAG: beta-ketoacyl-[acyl-carrier-protein] synthase II, partial [Henriciella sp.]|nr:beta-ketoacyl-[acyl-carrier-protein] synthase II [Henriciella sp.]
RVSPLLVPKMMANAVSGEASIWRGLKGPNYTTVSACASGARAICR